MATTATTVTQSTERLNTKGLRMIVQSPTGSSTDDDEEDESNVLASDNSSAASSARAAPRNTGKDDNGKINKERVPSFSSRRRRSSLASSSSSGRRRSFLLGTTTGTLWKLRQCWSDLASSKGHEHQQRHHRSKQPQQEEVVVVVGSKRRSSVSSSSCSGVSSCGSRPCRKKFQVVVSNATCHSDSMEAMIVSETEESEEEAAFQENEGYEEDEVMVTIPPELQPLQISNLHGTPRNVVANHVFDMENEFWRGKAVLMMRTTAPAPPPNDSIYDYFEANPQLKFELQMQLQWKRLPEGPLFVGFALASPINLNPLTRIVTSTMLKAITNVNRSCHYSYGHQEEDGRCELPHLCFGLERSMNRLLVTKPGETPPTLGRALPLEDGQFFNFRRSVGHGAIEWNLQDTYTMCSWTPFIDWRYWHAAGLPVPGIRSVGLSDIVGDRPIQMTIYSVPSPKSNNQAGSSFSSSSWGLQNQKHYQSELQVIANVEFSHSQFTASQLR